MDQVLGVNAALLDCEGYPVDGQHVGRNAIVDVVGFGVADYIVEAIPEDGFKLLVDDGFLPKVTLAVLNPLKVAGGDSAGIGENVGDDEDAFSERISSATAVVGPLAPSTMMRALIFSALRLVMTFSVAAGMRISQSVIRSSSAGHGSAPGKPRMELLRYLYSSNW